MMSSASWGLLPEYHRRNGLSPVAGLELLQAVVRRIRLMSAFPKLLVLTCALLLALPPGWCCATPNPKAADLPAQPTHSCCQHEQPTPNQEPMPAVPVQQCCCEKDLASPSSPSSPKTTSLDLAISIPVVIPDAPAAHVAGVGVLDFAGPSPSPPLNVLQCVWRC